MRTDLPTHPRAGVAGLDAQGCYDVETGGTVIGQGLGCALHRRYGVASDQEAVKEGGGSESRVPPEAPRSRGDSHAEHLRTSITPP